jgi:antitoxin component HigA of HigAB toxin-antitoxin module
MSHIGPNFRPPWQQQPQSSGASSSAQPSSVPSEATHAQFGASGTAQEMPCPPQATLAPLFAFENALAPDQLVQLLRNLLQMPREMVQLLAMFAEVDPTLGQALLKTLLAQEAPVPLEAVQQFLQTHMDKAQDKLLKLLQSSQMSMTGSGQQMGELLGTLSELVAKTGKSPMEALHTAISLYLPYYPLHPPQAFSLRFESPEEQEGRIGGPDQAQLVLFIETITLGQFKITIAMVEPGKLHALIEHDPPAEPILDTICAQIQAAFGHDDVQPVTLIFLPRKITATNQLPSEQTASTEGIASSGSSGKQSVGIHPEGGVSAGLLCLGYLLIRVIFELDKRSDLHHQRAERI